MFKIKIFKKPNLFESMGLFFSFLLIGLFAFGKLYIVKANSHSDQDGYYLIISSNSKNLNIDDYVAFCIPDYAHVYIAKTYGLPKGKCHFNSAALIKHIIANDGKTISINRDGVYVNGIQRSFYTSPKITFIKLTNVKLKKDELIVLGTNKQSFDSRYFGIVNRKFVIGKAYLIWKI